MFLIVLALDLIFPAAQPIRATDGEPLGTDDPDDAPEQDDSATEGPVAVTDVEPPTTLPFRFAALPDDGVDRAVRTPVGQVLPILPGPAPSVGYLVRSPCGARAVVAAGQPISRVHAVIDAGRGGADTGTVTPDGLSEAELNLELANRVAALLSVQGVEVVVTRAGDIQLDPATRSGIAASLGPALVVSLHQASGAAQVLEAADRSGSGSAVESDPPTSLPAWERIQVGHPGVQILHGAGDDDGAVLSERIHRDLVTLLVALDTDRSQQAAIDELELLTHIAATWAGEVELALIAAVNAEARLRAVLAELDPESLPMRPAVSLPPGPLELGAPPRAPLPTLPESDVEPVKDIAEVLEVDADIAGWVDSMWAHAAAVAELQDERAALLDQAGPTPGMQAQNLRFESELIRVDELLAASRALAGRVGPTSEAVVAAFVAQRSESESGATSTSVVPGGAVPPTSTDPAPAPTTVPRPVRPDGDPEAPIEPREPPVVDPVAVPAELVPLETLEWVGGGGFGAPVNPAQDPSGLLDIGEDLTTIVVEGLHLDHPSESALLADPDIRESFAEIIATASVEHLEQAGLPPIAPALDQSIADDSGADDSCIEPDLGTRLSPAP